MSSRKTRSQSQLQMEGYEHFKHARQDYEKANVDVTFIIKDMKLFAHRQLLAGVSETFSSMLSERWTSKNEPIKIEIYPFEIFQQLLIFIYSGKCNNLNMENIYEMIDISEFYGVKQLKNECDKFMVENVKINFENYQQMFDDFANKYSLENFKYEIAAFLMKNLNSMVKSGKFFECKKTIIENLVKIGDRKKVTEMELFEAIFKWAENQAKNKTHQQNSTKNESIFYLNAAAIKKELEGILPFFKFQNISYTNLMQIIAEKSFIFSSQELSEILRKHSEIIVTVYNENGQCLQGKLLDDYGIYETINDGIKDRLGEVSLSSDYREHHYVWKVSRQIPSKSSHLKKDLNIKYYLNLNVYGQLILVTSKTMWDSDYLLAEMVPPNGEVFKGTNICKIKAERNP